MLRLIYSLLFYLAVPLILIRALIKAQRSKGYLTRFKERFGYIQQDIPAGGIWLHAVSVGEVIASVPLMKRLQKLYPDKHITITTMTPTGAERVKAAYEDSVSHVYVPYDTPGAIKKFLNKTQPSLVLIMETELWPNFLYFCQKYRIPTFLLNARLSEKSARGYAKLGSFTRQMLQKLSMIAVQNQDDAKRFMRIGANPCQLVVTGSIKFDVSIPASIHEKAQVFRDLLGNDRLVWLAASTHEHEEEKILQVYQQIRAEYPQLLLVIVPRHPERFTKVVHLCKKQGYEVVMRSSNQACQGSTDIFIGDSMGELSAFYAACDVTFVGGSFVPVGGHNLLEPAALGIPAITGPHVFNFAEITRLLVDAGAVYQVNDTEHLSSVLRELFNDSAKRSDMGQKGLAVIQQNGGALDAHIKLIQGMLTEPQPMRA